jgi:hypothetical protein
MDSDLEWRGPVLCAPDVNGRQIKAVVHPEGEWRWTVGVRGPTIMGIPMYVWWWAGNTREQAETVALELGPMPAEGDETETAKAIVERIRTFGKSN